jgi:Na+/proline symporter
MGIGAGILLIAIGAILAFAVNWHVSGLDLQVVGWILMVVGVFGVVLFFTFWNRRSGARVVTERRAYDEPVVTERRVYDDPPPPPGV